MVPLSRTGNAIPGRRGLLTCTHKEAVSEQECIQQVIGNLNSENLILATMTNMQQYNGVMYFIFNLSYTISLFNHLSYTTDNQITKYMLYHNNLIKIFS